MERRDFIRHSAAIASLTAVGDIAVAKPVTRNESSDARACRDGVVLVDERFSDSRRFATAFAARGASVLSLAEDIGRLWYGQLRTHCLQSSGFVAGLTLHTDLYVSQQFAREYGKTFMQVGAHDCRGRRTLTHTLAVNAALDLRDSESWAEVVASAMLIASPFGADRVLQTSRVMRASDHPGSLYSWLIV